MCTEKISIKKGITHNFVRYSYIMVVKENVIFLGLTKIWSKILLISGNCFKVYQLKMPEKEEGGMANVSY